MIKPKRSLQGSGCWRTAKRRATGSNRVLDKGNQDHPNSWAQVWYLERDGVSRYFFRSLGWFGTFKEVSGMVGIYHLEVSSLQSCEASRYFFLKVRQGNHLIWASIRLIYLPHCLWESPYCKATAPVSTAWHSSQTLMTGWGADIFNPSCRNWILSPDPESGSWKMCQATT